MKKTIFYKLQWVLMVLCFSSVSVTNAYAIDEKSSQQVIVDPEAGETLNGFLAKMQNMQSDFYQKVTTADGELIEESTGTFYLSKPGRFRWNYVPEDGADNGNVINSDGKKLSMYDADLETLSERQLDEVLGQVPTLILVRENVDLSSLFNVSRLSREGGEDWYQLLPVSTDATYDYMQIALKDTQLSAMKVKDFSGQLITVSFNELRPEAVIPQNVFEFKAPEGTDILSQ